jgi:hypothetical protein
MYESLKGNTNAEKWTLEEATKLFENAILIAKEKQLDFIGEVALELDTYREIFVYLKDKFIECKIYYKKLEQICEANCFSHGKTGDIVPSLAIMNLKSNHGWTDRVESTNTNTNINQDVTPISFVKSNNDKDK